MKACRGRSCVIALTALLLAAAGRGRAVAGQAPTSGAPGTHLLIVTGLGGGAEYGNMFHEQALSMRDAALDRWGVPESQIVWLAEDETRDSRIKDKATREAVDREITALAGRAGPQDAVLILLIGHGSGQGEDARINLPGPDIAGSDLSGWLAAFSTQTVAVVNTASASGGFLPVLSGDRRIVVTATRSIRERERTHFGSYFVQAFAQDVADADKDERISLLEAFVYARGEVERHYSRENQLLTEHALLDDNGDGEGSDAPALAASDGALAARFFLAAAAPAVAERAASDPELAALLNEKTRIETDIAALRALRSGMDPDAYDAELEALLLELVRVNGDIREKGGGG